MAGDDGGTSYWMSVPDTVLGDDGETWPWMSVTAAVTGDDLHNPLLFTPPTEGWKLSQGYAFCASMEMSGEPCHSSRAADCSLVSLLGTLVMLPDI